MLLLVHGGETVRTSMKRPLKGRGGELYPFNKIQIMALTLCVMFTSRSEK